MSKRTWESESSSSSSDETHSDKQPKKGKNFNIVCGKKIETFHLQKCTIQNIKSLRFKSQSFLYSSIFLEINIMKQNFPVNSMELIYLTFLEYVSLYKYNTLLKQQ